MLDFLWKSKKSARVVHDSQETCSERNVLSLLADIPGFWQDLPFWREAHESLTSEFDEANEDLFVSRRSSGDLSTYSIHGAAFRRSTDKLTTLAIVKACEGEKTPLDLWTQIALQSDDVRVKAIDVLGMLRDRTNALIFVQALYDGYWEVRAAAAQALGELREQALVAPLLKALQDESDFTVRQSLVRALGKCKQERSIKLLMQLLRDQDQNWQVREAAAWSLGKFGRTVPIWPLVEALFSDPDEMVRAAAARALGEIEPPGIHPMLEGMMRGNEDEDVREAVEWALQQLERKGRWSKVLRAIKDVPRNWLLSPAPPQKERLPSQREARDSRQTVHTSFLFALMRFIRDKSGFVSHAELVHCDQQPTLFLNYCYQQTGQTLRDEVISQFEEVVPIEPMGSVVANRRELLQEVERRVTEIQMKRRWYETNIVILELHPDGGEPTRAVLCGIGCHAVRSSDSPILAQLLQRWGSYFQNLQEVSHLQIGYQSCDTNLHS
jgi:HEAT repeat protein